MHKIRYLLIVAIDWVDEAVLRHCFYGKYGGLCYLIGNSSWWGEEQDETA